MTRLLCLTVYLFSIVVSGFLGLPAWPAGARGGGRIETAAGTAQSGYSGAGGPATAALLREPNDCCLDGAGGLLIADVADWRVRRLALKSGTITTFGGTGKPAGKIDPARGDGGPATRAVIVEARA